MSVPKFAAAVVQGPFALCFGSCRAACAFQAIHISTSMGCFKYLYLVTLLLVCSRPCLSMRPREDTAADNDEDSNGDDTTDDSKESEVNKDELQENHRNLHGKPRPPPINHHIWKILADYPSLVHDLHRHPRCLEVLALAIERNATENENVTEKKDHWSQDRQLMDEIERHSQCSPLLLGILVKPDPSGIRDLFSVHPEGVLIVQAFVIGLVTYFILSQVIRTWAIHVASNVKDPLACLNDPAPPVPWVLSWIFACCYRKSSDEHDPGSSDGENLESAWKGLDESQQRHLRSVMHKARSLQVAGIAEQRVSGMWKMIEMGAAALTPIFISIEGMFGTKFSQPLKVVAILLSLVTTVCQIAPKNQATAILDYHARLRKLVFAYWSLTGIFDVYEKEEQRPSMDTSEFQDMRASVFSTFVMAFSSEVQDAENELKDVFTTTRLTKDQLGLRKDEKDESEDSEKKAKEKAKQDAKDAKDAKDAGK